ncbi:uncharacterized protein LOC126213029 [Schistocerca nitens]|uniref:uncharacterized protein LOC126213029 n=1 Tax=Schistocerca nitens TaxID=7011 RepID=UPI0021198F93|nr:uncharacterized protein LOC126213029 [Schistocerca nitens]XP_049796555.1 uncharacterized protein LOC126213029 [Schistocerca nitens]XP_049796556.1 uncharacterized protein LOC126213029 [Schistocerca nitens]
MLPPTYVPGFHDEEAVRAMRYNDLGTTGLEVSHLGLGGGPLGIYGDYPEEDAIATVREAIRQGINYIDTAPFYGLGRSEEVLGKALKGVPRQAYYIATKVGRYTMDPRTMFDFSAQKTRESFAKSLELLQLDYVDIIQVHDVEFVQNPDVIIRETLPVLQEFVAVGKARFIGITGYPLEPLREIVEKSGSVKVDTVLSYTRDTLVDDTLQRHLPFFKEKGVGVICAAGTAMGLLSSTGPQPWHPAPQKLRDACRAAADYCKERGVELARLAMHHALTREGQATHVVGINSTQILRSNLQILRDGLTSTEQEVLRDVQKKFFAQLPVRHWEGLELTMLREEWRKMGML